MINKRKPIPKTQRELSISQQEPYVPPVGAPGFSPTGNPNSIDINTRAEQVSFKGDTVKPLSIGIQDIDGAVMYYIQDVIQPFVIQNGERLSVPVIYGSPEKWKSFQRDGYYRDLQGRIMAPLMMMKRNTIDKNRSITNKLDANNPYNIAVISQRYNKQNEYSRFNLVNNTIPEKTYYATVVPDYLTITYDCVLFTYYNDQLAKLIEMMEYASDSYWGNPERFKFRVNIDSFSTVSELSENAERIVRATFTLKLFGYIIPDIPQKDLNGVKKFSSTTQVKFGLETIGGPNENFIANADQTSKQKSGVASVIGANHQVAGTYLNPTTITFPYGWLVAPVPLPATNASQFVFFVNGQLIEPSAITSFTESGGASTLIINSTALGFSFISSDEIIGIGKFDI